MSLTLVWKVSDSVMMTSHWKVWHFSWGWIWFSFWTLQIIKPLWGYCKNWETCSCFAITTSDFWTSEGVLSIEVSSEMAAVKMNLCCIWKDTFIICYHNTWNFWLLFHSVGNFTFWNMSVCIKVIRTLHKSFKKLVFWSILELENRIGVTWFLSVLLLGYRVGTTSDGDHSVPHTIPGKSVHSLL